MDDAAVHPPVHPYVEADVDAGDAGGETSSVGKGFCPRLDRTHNSLFQHLCGFLPKVLPKGRRRFWVHHIDHFLRGGRYRCWAVAAHSMLQAIQYGHSGFMILLTRARTYLLRLLHSFIRGVTSDREHRTGKSVAAVSGHHGAVQDAGCTQCVETKTES